MKKRSVQLVFYSAYCILAILGLLADFGIFDGTFSTRPFVMYTSWSNMLCSACMVISFVRILRHGESELWPLCKFIFVVMILITAVVFNILLNPFKSLMQYFASAKSSIYHLILPTMFVLDWILFYRRGTVKPLQPLLGAVLPLVYVVYILLRAVIVKSAGITVGLLYPYFFLNVDSLGWGGFIKWLGILLVLLLALGYGLYGMDRLLYLKMPRKKKTPETGVR